MNQNFFEIQLLEGITNSSGTKIWLKEDVKALMEENGHKISQRSLERKIAQIDWLKCESESSKQTDEFQSSANSLVFDNLILQARKKRKTSLFVKLHNFSTNTDNKDLVEYNILVAEDGKGSKRWSYLIDTTDISILAALQNISQSKEVVFFPSGVLVSFCRKYNLNKIQTKKKIEIQLGHFYERISFDYSNSNMNKISEQANQNKLSHLERLESESINIIREVMANADNPVMLYSIGKDSAVMLHLAKKAFFPSLPPFPLMHVDTRWKFQAMYKFRDRVVRESNMELITHINPEGIEKNINPFDHGSALHTDIMKTQGLKQALDLHGFDVAFGGARRDEEKSRAKERIFSFRNSNHRWDPKNQRPELWNLFNCRKAPGETIRVFPLSNWTELDIWQYIYKESIPIVPLYFSAKRPVIERNGMLIMVDDDRMQLLHGESIELKEVRFRTLGCYPLTGAVESSASNLSDIILELLQSRTSERDGRAIDSDSGASMEKKKQEGYF